VLLLKEATERDSQFAEAWTLLAEVHGAIFSYGYDRSAIRQSDAYQALDQAPRLQPDFGTVHLVHGTLLMQIQGKYDEAIAEFQTAHKTIPNSSRCYFMIGVIKWIRGHYQNVETSLIHAYELDPRYVFVISELVTWYKANRNYDAEANLIDHVLAAGVSSQYFTVRKARISLDKRADTGPYRAFIESLPKTRNSPSRLTLSRYQLALVERNYAEAYRVLVEDGRESMKAERLAFRIRVPISRD
jgi:Tfp pilus assembly protein PilF